MHAGVRDLGLYKGQGRQRQSASGQKRCIANLQHSFDELHELNSSLLESYLQSVSTTLRGGWFRTFPQFLRQLPIKLPTTPAEKKLADQITQRVEQIIKLKKKLQGKQLGEQEKARLERQVEASEQQIDALVCRLCGVDTLPAS